MGAINFLTSDVITLAVEPYDFDDVRRDILETYEESEAEEITDNQVYEAMEDYYLFFREEAETVLRKYDFYNYSVCVESGYYESIQINIKFNFDCFDDYIEKREAQKEATQLKKCLLELAGVGFASCRPSWCTSYADYTETVNAINEAIKEERKRLAGVPTWSRYAKYWKQKTACLF